MAVKTRIPMEKIMAVKKKLQKLPTKETGKTREEALEILAGDFQVALKKGYSVKEIREILGEEGVTLALGKWKEGHTTPNMEYDGGKES